MANDHRPTDEQLRTWLDPSRESESFPPYWDSEHHDYLDAMFTELLERRAAAAEPRVITDPAELTELPHRAVVVDTTTGKAWQRNHMAWTSSAGFLNSRELVARAGSLLLIHIPEGSR